MVFQTAMKHKALIPLLACMAGGVTIATVQIYRACVRYPDVSFNRKKNPHPWLHVKPKENVKFFTTEEFKKHKPQERPKF